MALALSGCQTSKEVYRAGQEESSETLLDAEGQYELVEEKGEGSPLENHMRTRDKVEPSKISKSKSYTKNVRNAHVDEDVHYRVLKLQKDIASLRSDLENIVPQLRTPYPPEPGHKPEFKTAAATQKEDPVQVVKAPKLKPKPVKKTSAKKVSSADVIVTALRTGEHPGKTRLVLDVSGESQYEAALDNEQRVLVIDLPRTEWNAAQSKSFGKHGLLKRYQVQSRGDGSRLLIELKKAVTIPTNLALKPNRQRGHRIVLDLAAK